MGPASTKTPSTEPVIADTGLLVALYASDDPQHASARRWIGAFGGRLVTSPAVLAETAWQLPARHRALIAKLAHSGAVQLHAPDTASYARMAWLLDKYANLDPDWADIELLCLAETTGIRRIATLDAADFGVYRIHGRRAFDIVWPPR